MCFYNDETPEFYSESISKSRKEYRCEGCSNRIFKGELYSRASGKCDGEMYVLKICGACELDIHRIHIHELAEGCYEYESWCQPGDLCESLPEYGMDRSSREDGQRFLMLARSNGRRRITPAGAYV